MPEKSLRVLVASADAADLQLLRRLCLDTPYHVDAARSAGLAMRTLAYRRYAAIITDDERLPGMSGAELLAEVERRQPHVLRLLLARNERRKALATGAKSGRYRLFIRPLFASHVHAALMQHVPRPSATTDANTTPHELSVGGPVARRRMLLTLAEMVEAKAAHHAGHAARVSTLVSALGRETGLSRIEVDALEEAALLHDVGELGLDGALLQTRRRYTPAETRQMRFHVEVSQQIATRSGLSRTVIAAIRHHHERWDGKGYPDRLAGPKIPLPARMLAVADTWDAIATDRPYRQMLSPDECARTLALLGGQQLDGALVDLFLRRRIYQVIDWSDPPGNATNLLAPHA